MPRRRATVEEALRRAVEIGQRDRDRRADGQRAYLERLTARADIKVLNSGEMWQSPHVSRVRETRPGRRLLRRRRPEESIQVLGLATTMSWEKR